MIEKLTPSRVIFNIFNYGFMILFSVLCIAPVWHVFMASVSTPAELVRHSGLVLKPLGEMTLAGFKLVFENQEIWIGYLNTLFYVLWYAVAGTVFTLIAGFLVTRKDFKLARPTMVIIVFTMMFNGGLIPTYMVIRALGMVNTRWAVMIPGMVAAFNVIMIKTAFEGLSNSYEESAKLDGAGPLTILFRILTPLVKANLAVVALFTIVAQWNAWYPASIYLPRVREAWPLQLFMREILIQNSTAVSMLSAETVKGELDFTNELVRYCVIVVGTLPILCAYPFAQKYFVKGATLGGVKG